jgi:hypothetical protein
MKHSIIDKLRDLLTQGITRECEVVYLLCEIRKILEKTPAHERPFALNMYCHWALHVDLSGTDTIMPFLSRVDGFVDGYLADSQPLIDSHQMVREFFFLDTFRDQLREFFVAEGLPTDLTDDGDRWNEFVRNYAGVIEDGSLVCHARNHTLRHVKQVTFTKGGDKVGAFGQLPFNMRWGVALHDGHPRGIRIDVDVNAGPTQHGNPMIFWGVQLLARQAS